MLNQELKLSREIFSADIKQQPTRNGYGEGLVEVGKKDPNVVVLCCDLTDSTKVDAFKKKFPNRFIEVGVAEQNLAGLAAGLALEGKIPFIYTITSFYMRAAETIGLYLHGEQLPVKLVGSGRDGDYHIDGPSHHGGLAQAFLAPLNVLKFYPETKEDVVDYLETIIKNEKPCFLSLRR